MDDEDDLDFVQLSRKEAKWMLSELSPHMITTKEVRDVMRFITGKFRMREPNDQNGISNLPH